MRSITSAVVEAGRGTDLQPLHGGIELCHQRRAALRMAEQAVPWRGSARARQSRSLISATSLHPQAERAQHPLRGAAVVGADQHEIGMQRDGRLPPASRASDSGAPLWRRPTATGWSRRATGRRSGRDRPAPPRAGRRRDCRRRRAAATAAALSPADNAHIAKMKQQVLPRGRPGQAKREPGPIATVCR